VPARGQWLTFAWPLCLGFVLLFVRSSGGDKPFDINCPSGTIGRLAALDPLAWTARLALIGAQTRKHVCAAAAPV